MSDIITSGTFLKTRMSGLKFENEALKDRIEELEKLEALIKDFFILLDRTEETDDGRVFRPNRISSCRAMDAQELEDLLRLMKATVEGETND